MTASASSNRPGFSYFVGLTDSMMSRLRNFSEAGSFGGEAILGKFRSDRYGGEVCGLSEGTLGACCERGRDDDEACL